MNIKIILKLKEIFWYISFGFLPSAQLIEDEIRQAEEKFAESLHLAQMGMFNLFENEVEQVSQLCTFVDALLEYHEQCVEILKTMTETLHEK